MSEGIFAIKSEKQFEASALELFREQYDNVPVYRKFCRLLGVNPNQVNAVPEIPFLPVELFKTERIIWQGLDPETIFESSGTTGSVRSRHFVADLSIYRKSFETAFEQLVGDPGEMVVLALLPSYLERNGSSLVFMADRLIQSSRHELSGFYLDRLEALAATLRRCQQLEIPTLLIGVTFALLDLAEAFPLQLRNTRVMETGGMKGRRTELVREEVHSRLKKAFGLKEVASEYGMTELLSQAYSQADGMFCCPPWMRVLTRDPEDPFSLVTGRSGGINVVDLANRYSCAFIATQDLGKVYPDGRFEVLGRFDNSDIRGCNLMVL